MIWETYQLENGGTEITLKRAPPRLPWRCQIRTGELSENCHCARFDDNSCVPAHLMPVFVSRRDHAYAEKQRGKNGEWIVDRRFADVTTYTWSGFVEEVRG